jgi:hypothetical protein
VRTATAACVCLLLLTSGASTAAAATTRVVHTPAAASPAVRALRHEIRVVRGRTLRDAFEAALPAPPHGHAERRATTAAELAPILERWRARHRRYRAALARRAPILAGFACIHRSEGPWNAVSDSDPTYYGGLQMDRAFERAWGGDVLRSSGRDADAWSAHDQLMVAMRAYRELGYAPWPNTAAACGLL